MNLADKHSREHVAISPKERLHCLDMSPGAFGYLQRSIRERNARESIIPEDDVAALVKQVIDYPFLGGRKGSLKLVEDQKALIGETLYKETKEMLKNLSEEEYFHRRHMSQLQRNFEERKRYDEDFTKPFACFVHDVWAIDYMFIAVLGFKFALCVAYDIFSQSYVALVPGEVPCGQLAQDTLLVAMENTATKPYLCVLSDNDATFCGDEFQNFLSTKLINHKTIPAGKPWFNGEIESGNRDLRKAILTLALKKACDSLEITKKGQSRKRILNFLSICCNEMRIILNTEIPRLKFKTTPQKVCDGLVDEQNQKRNTYIDMKKKQRKERMVTIKKQGDNRKNSDKTFVEKVKAKWKKIVKNMSLEQIFAFNEAIHARFQAITV